MATFKKWNKTEKRNIYYLDYRDENGKRQRPSTGSGSATFANELLTNKIDEVNQRKRLPERYSPPVKFSEFVDNEYLPIHAKGQKTEREYKCAIRNYWTPIPVVTGHPILFQLDR